MMLTRNELIAWGVAGATCVAFLSVSLVSASLAQNVQPSWAHTLPARGDFLTSDEQLHGTVLDAKLEAGRLVASLSSGANCVGTFQVTGTNGLSGDFSLSCSDGRQGRGNYALESSGDLSEISGIGCVRLSKSDINDMWVARIVFGSLVFAPGYPEGLTCGAR